MKIYVIYTVKSMLDSYGPQIKAAFGARPLALYEIYDSSIAMLHPNCPREDVERQRQARLRYLMRAAEVDAPDALVVACSTVGLETERLKPEFSFPVVCIDDFMLREAAESSKSITVFATSPNPVTQVTERLLSEARRAGRQVDIKVRLCEEALPWLLANRMDKFQEAVLEYVRSIREDDTIVLAQGSTAFLEAEIARVCECRVLSSPASCIRYLVSVANQIEPAFA